MSFIAINIRTSHLGLSLCSPSVSLDDVARVAGGKMTRIQTQLRPGIRRGPMSIDQREESWSKTSPRLGSTMGQSEWLF